MLSVNLLSEEPVLTINSKSNIVDQPAIPRNFRVTSAEAIDKLKSDNECRVNLNGLNELKISGSAQFSVMELAEIISKIGQKNNIFIVDLRLEWHGFLNGVPVNWYGVQNASNKGKCTDQIVREEEDLLKKLYDQKDINIGIIESKDKSGQKVPTTKTVPFKVSSFLSESGLTTKNKLGYLRLPVSDALAPSKEVVAEFLDFVAKLPAGSWIHFHCAAGRGRTTTFMVMYDIIRNGKKVSLVDILNRHELLGGSNLAAFGSEKSWKYPHAVKRYQFIQKFYQFVNETKELSSCEWLKYTQAD